MHIHEVGESDGRNVALSKEVQRVGCNSRLFHLLLQHLKTLSLVRSFLPEELLKHLGLREIGEFGQASCRHDFDKLLGVDLPPGSLAWDNPNTGSASHKKDVMTRVFLFNEECLPLVEFV